MEHILKKAKGLHRNIYQIPIAKEYWIDFILVLLGASAIYSGSVVKTKI